MFLLVSLSHIYDISPVLLIFSFEIAQEIIKAFVTASQVLNRCIQRLTLGLFVVLDKPLNFLNLLDCFGATGIAALKWFLSVTKE